MTTATSPDPIEARVREMFAARRYLPSLELRERLISIPAREGRLSVFRSGSRLLRFTLAGVPIAFVLLVLGVVFATQVTRRPSDPAPPVGTTETLFDPYLTGPGILASEPDALLTVVPWLIAAVVVWGVVLFAAKRRRAFRVLAVILAMAAGISAYGVATQPGPVWANAYGGGLGIELVDTPNPFEGRDVANITADPGEPFSIAFNIKNPGILPIKVIGIIYDPFPGQPMGWAALWMDPEGWPGFREIDVSRPFEPIELAPDAALNLYLVGRAGACAVAPEASTGSGASRDSVRVAYQVLGLTGVMEMDLPLIVVQYERENCSP